MSMLSKNKITAVLAVTLTVSLTGCAQYMNHRDSVTLGAGDAVETNSAIHAESPWPSDVSNTDIDVEGKRTPLGKRKKKAALPK